jgi:hypothetical protein
LRGLSRSFAAWASSFSCSGNNRIKSRTNNSLLLSAIYVK